MTGGSKPSPYWVELSAENLPLALLELSSCLSGAAGTSVDSRPVPWSDRLVEVDLPGDAEARRLGERLTLAYRIARPLGEGPLDVLTDALMVQGTIGGRSASVRLALGGTPELARRLPVVLGHAYVQGGGRIDLEHPDRRFLLYLDPARTGEPPSSLEGGVAESLFEVGRAQVAERRSKNRPFRKPVTLPPRIARVVVNLAQIPVGGTLLDPFCGTGSILLEGAHLGYRTFGADLDAEMVRGTLKNLQSRGFAPERIVQGTIRELPQLLAREAPFDGVVFDPPYGRQASTGGSGASEVLQEALDVLPALLRPGSRAVILTDDPSRLGRFPAHFRVEAQLVAERVHRSLTRWVVVVHDERTAASPPAPLRGA